ncbi:unnamed protein product [Discosporangium mesarthrocarpum]
MKDGGKVSRTLTPIDAEYQQAKLIALTICFGCVSGILAYTYAWAMETSLWLAWEVVPEKIMEYAESFSDGILILNKYGFLYTMVVAIVLSFFVGMAQKYMEYPGDLAEVVLNVYECGYVPMYTTLPMIVISLLGITAGVSLGPEAPLVAVTSSVCGLIARKYLKLNPHMVRKCTLIGMAAGLSAFFGVQFGGALFSIEVCNTMGAQFNEVTVYAVAAGGICLSIYVGLRGDSFGDIWDWPAIPNSTYSEIILGCLLGVLAGFVGIFFRSMHKTIGKIVKQMGLGSYKKSDHPIVLSVLGGIVLAVIGVLFPPTMFWSEFEIGSIASPGLPLEHIWPQGGFFYGLAPYEWESPPMYLAVGFFKLVAISVTIHAGFRGGFIFPLFFVGCAFGRSILPALMWILPTGWVNVSAVLVCMSMAAGLNVAITRTPFASPLILISLCGVQAVGPPIISASLAALFVTRKHQFIMTQQGRADIVFVDDLVGENKEQEEDGGADEFAKNTGDEATSLVSAVGGTVGPEGSLVRDYEAIA